MALKIGFSTVLSILVLASQAFGTSVRTLNLPELVRGADRVFYGTCLGVDTARDAGTGLVISQYRFQVHEALKGVNVGEIIQFRQVAAGGVGISIPGIPAYIKGQKILLFLYPDSRLGLTSPVGLAQGTFQRSRPVGSSVGFKNPLNNSNLLAGLSSDDAADAGLSEADLARLAPNEPIPLGFFRDLVIRVDEMQRRGEVSIR
ncbi:MAG: hypothetical protein JSU96_12420 [Acidobacteriota bacterium]|nr:MAG: hypothetical protein JSU96_12420 [Acidobacteriota bacterium]